MGVMLVLGAILVIGIICYFIYEHSDVGEWLCGIGVGCIVISSLLGVIFGVACIAASMNADLQYIEMIERKTAIEYRLDNIENEDSNLLVNGGVYNDIVEYNNEIHYYRKWGRNNFWTGWFNPAPIDELELIKLDKSIE